MNKSFSVVAAMFFFALLAGAFYVYQPALSGGFLFDDTPNLEPMGYGGGVTDARSLKTFVLGGGAGPTGRPIALASFLLDDNTWPSNPVPFKLTNLEVHLLCGMVLFWATLNLLRLFRFAEPRAVMVALLSSGIWLLHPANISTVMYIVQRMAQLSALFMLAGIAAYLHGRLLLERGKNLKAYLWMSISLPLATLLATFSKENGALLPVMVLAIEACLSATGSSLNKRWKALFLWAPAGAIVIYLLSIINFSSDAWPARPFNQKERLLTEGRVLWQYLYNIYIPKFEGFGLLRDGFVISRGLFEPINTLFALLGLMAVFTVSWIYRKKFPLFSLAILFWGASQLLESTTVNLELYFEHRNYIGSVFLFLPFAALLAEAAIRTRVKVTVGIIILVFLGFITHERAKLWGNVQALQLYWSKAAVRSPRGRNYLAGWLAYTGKEDKAIKLLKDSIENLPPNSFLTLTYMDFKMNMGVLTPQELNRVANKLKSQGYDLQTVKRLKKMTKECIEKGPEAPCLGQTLKVIKYLDANVNFNNVLLYRKVSEYAKTLLYLHKGDYIQAEKSGVETISSYSEPSASIQIVSKFAQKKRYSQALRILGVAETLFKSQSKEAPQESDARYKSEFNELRKKLKEDAGKEK